MNANTKFNNPVVNPFVNLDTVEFAFGNKCIDLIFNKENEDFTDIGLNGTPWKSEYYANALIAFALGFYGYTDNGVFLKYKSFADLQDVLEDENAGRATGEGLTWLIANKLATFDLKDVEASVVYNLNYTGFGILPQAIPYVKHVAGEEDYKSHNRSTIRQVQTMDKLVRASKKGINIRLFYSEKNKYYFEGESGLQHKIELWKNGQFEELNTLVNTQIKGQKTYKAIAKNTRLAEEATEEEPFVANGKWELRDGEGNAVDLSLHMDKICYFRMGGVVMTKNPMLVSAENIETIKSVAYELKATLFIEEPVVKDVKIDSKVKKGKGKVKKAPAKAAAE